MGNKISIKALYISAGFLLLAGCCVKSDPVAPPTPAEIGRGRPLYRGEEETGNPPAVPKAYETEKSQDENTDDEQKR